MNLVPKENCSQAIIKKQKKAVKIHDSFFFLSYPYTFAILNKLV